MAGLTRAMASAVASSIDRSYAQNSSKDLHSPALTRINCRDALVQCGLAPRPRGSPPQPRPHPLLEQASPWPLAARPSVPAGRARSPEARARPFRRRATRRARPRDRHPGSPGAPRRPAPRPAAPAEQSSEGGSPAVRIEREHRAGQLGEHDPRESRLEDAEEFRHVAELALERGRGCRRRPLWDRHRRAATAWLPASSGHPRGSPDPAATPIRVPLQGPFGSNRYRADTGGSRDHPRTMHFRGGPVPVTGRGSARPVGSRCAAPPVDGPSSTRSGPRHVRPASRPASECPRRRVVRARPRRTETGRGSTRRDRSRWSTHGHRADVDAISCSITVPAPNFSSPARSSRGSTTNSRRSEPGILDQRPSGTS